VSLAGTSLALTSIAMESPVAAIGGTARLDVSRGDLDVKYDARVTLSELQKWLTKLPPLEGVFEVSGTIGGTLDHPVGSFDSQIKRLQSQEVTDASVSVAGRWSVGSDDRSVPRLEPRAGANLNGSARLVGDDKAPALRAEASEECPGFAR
jgi:autotransporter translocation and assembly factor TamB